MWDSLTETKKKRKKILKHAKPKKTPKNQTQLKYQQHRAYHVNENQTKPNGKEH